MALIELKAVLWRRVNEATFDTLIGDSRGQYDIRLTTDPDVERFFEGLAQHDPTDKGGYTIDVPIAPFEGEDPVDAAVLQVRYMGPESIRKDWYIRAQRPETAYPLWRPGRGLPTTFVEGKRDFVILVRDINDKFHARWISDEAFDQLPKQLRSLMLSKHIGVMQCPL
jgi:hypothetical protein